MTDANFIDAVQKFLPAACVQCQRYLGSMLALSLGEKILVSGTRGGEVAEGALLIGVRNAFWVARQKSREILNAESIDDENSSVLAKQLIDKHLISVSVDAPTDWLLLQFEGDLTLAIDRTNAWMTEAALVEITLPDGRIVEMNQHGTFQLLDEVDPGRS